MMNTKRLILSCVCVMGMSCPALAGEPGDDATRLTLEPTYLSQPPTPPAEAPAGDDTELAKKLSNPIANLISVPLQFNYDKGFGPKDAGVLRLNVQPVIPITLNEDWNLITRTIIPLVYQESPADGIDSQFGLGDTVQSFFFSPKQPFNGWIWGVGPVFNWPTATDDQLGSEKWGAGPTIVVLKQESGWTYGMLANHILVVRRRQRPRQHQRDVPPAVPLLHVPIRDDHQPEYGIDLRLDQQPVDGAYQPERQSAHAHGQVACAVCDRWPVVCRVP